MSSNMFNNAIRTNRQELTETEYRRIAEIPRRMHRISKVVETFNNPNSTVLNM